MNKYKYIKDVNFDTVGGINEVRLWLEDFTGGSEQPRGLEEPIAAHVLPQFHPIQMFGRYTTRQSPHLASAGRS